MNTNQKLNLTMLCDFYELTMGDGYFENGYKDRITYFDLFFRSVPDDGGFAIAAGLEQVIDYIQDLHFSKEDIDYLRERNLFSKDFLEYLASFRFTGDVFAVPEGTPVFPKEPILTVRAPAIEAQLIETYLLLAINHQSLIATKANRVVRAAQGRTVLEFGSRRAQGADAAILGARAAYIGGCHGTACTISDQMFGVKAGGTMAHSWVQMFDSQYEAFVTYCRKYPHNATLLVDTYDSLQSGVPDAIRAFNEVLRPMGITNCGIRIDSGDMTYLTKKARQMLDEAGWTDCKITVSNALDEYRIQDLLQQGACIDAFGVGERLITARSEPVFGGVYKLAAVEKENGEIIPRIKISENVAKITNPHFKKLYRLFANDTGKAIADYMCLHDEVVDDSKDLVIFDPEATWKQKTVYNFTAKELQVPVFKNGELVYERPTLAQIHEYCLQQVDTLWDEVKRFENPHTYYVDLSQKLWDIKYQLLKNKGKL
ncbi:MAG: nicotinate phosphoribosyltransferase [Ruminococcaceae bacterium]|nr:nicotinate phosphoribosyltransferase [Oscillospiraceae bacterium]